MEDRTSAIPDTSGLWSRFWTDAGRHGCTQSFPPAARFAIQQGWMRQLSKSPTATLLDVACGRGAVLDHARAAGVTSLIGVDRATQDSLGDGDGNSDIRGDIDASRLPFPDRSFDVVTSQFGIEYAGMDAAVLEAARVARSRLIFLMHAADGIVVQQAREQAEHAAWIDHDLGAFDLLRQAAATPDATRSALVADLIAKVTARAARAENVALLTGFAQIATALMQSPSIDEVDTLAVSWREHADRLGDLMRAAPGPERVEAAAGLLRTAGFSVELQDEVSHDGGLIGRWIIAQREEGRDS